MKRKIIAAVMAAPFVLGMLALQGCYETEDPAYGYGYGRPAPVVYASAPVYVGDRDEHHSWHDRDWWVSNHRDWVGEHHHEWLEHHDRD